MNLLWLIPVLMIGFPLLGAIFQAAAVASEKRRFPPPGQMVDVGGYRLHLHVMGVDTGKPTVILDAGMISASPNWAWVQPEIARVTRVVAYDRGGLGWSDPAPRPRDAGQSARELHTALLKAGIQGPYVLAGHSYGGLVSRAFAALYRSEVAGMVLVDASHPDQWARFGISSRVPAVGTRVSGFLANFGIFRIFDKEINLLIDGLPPRQAAELKALANRPGAYATVAAALSVWDDVTRPLVKQAGTLGDMPLIVLGVTEQPLKGKELTELQAELPGLSTRSQQRIVQGATHEGLVAKREHAQVVTQAILEVVEAAC